MKKLLLIICMLFSVTTFSQENKSFEETLQPYVEKALKGIEQGVEFASNEVPDLLLQYVIYKSIIYWCCVLLGIFMCTYLFNRWKRWYKRVDPDWDTPLPALPYLSFLIGCGILLFHIPLAIQSTFFPKLYLIEKFINVIS